MPETWQSNSVGLPFLVISFIINIEVKNNIVLYTTLQWFSFQAAISSRISVEFISSLIYLFITLLGPYLVLILLTLSALNKQHPSDSVLDKANYSPLCIVLWPLSIQHEYNPHNNNEQWLRRFKLWLSTQNEHPI